MSDYETVNYMMQNQTLKNQNQTLQRRIETQAESIINLQAKIKYLQPYAVKCVHVCPYCGSVDTDNEALDILELTEPDSLMNEGKYQIMTCPDCGKSIILEFLSFEYSYAIWPMPGGVQS